ncbi:MAG TPA: hypothetical protein VLL08_29475 [Kineosporiaceae bacterium]|nr:hypothetical protein [Kineosporiaceae bacterium]
MTKQMAFRLTDAEVAVLDDLIAAGLATDRTSALRRALAAERRRLDARHDAEIYASTAGDNDLLAAARWASDQELDLD